MAQRAPVRAVRPNRIPPHNLDAEQSVLGAMLESKEAIANVIDIVDADDFYKPAHATVYQRILDLYGRGEPADAITVADELGRHDELERIGGKPYIHGLLEAYPTASAAARYARIVEEHALLRRMIEAGGHIQEIGFEIPEDVSGAVDRAEEIVYQVGDRRLRSAVHPIKGLLSHSFEEIEKLAVRGEHVTGLASGFPDLDEMTAGFQEANLIIIAARPSMGKSSLLNDLALSTSLNQGKPSVIFSLEMSRHELVQRFLASTAKVDSQRLRRGALQEQDWSRLSGALGRLAEAPIFIDDSANISLMEMRAKCRRLKAKHGLGLIIIDYLQLMQSPSKSENRQQEVSEISRNLKILARELGAPVVCASQLNRGVEYRSDKRPLLADLRESGCVTGDTLVTLASGARVPIESLVGSQPAVVTLDGWHMSTARATKVWRTGRKMTYRLRLQSGRVIRATGNHKFRTLGEWRRLDGLVPGDRLAVPRSIPSATVNRWEPARLVLLAHLIGDGSFVKRQPLRYASRSEPNVAAVCQAAAAFGVTAEPRWDERARSFQVRLPAPYRLTHGRRNPICSWLEELGLFGLRSHQKFVPSDVFTLPAAQIALFLQHLWATDGCIWRARQDARGPKVRIYYSSSSRRLADDVQSLLAHLGIRSRVRVVKKGGYRDNFHVIVSGREDQLRFAHLVGGLGDKGRVAAEAVQTLGGSRSNTNVDTIPREVWDLVRSKMREARISHRGMAALRGSTYGGTSHYRFAPSRALLGQYAAILDDVELKELASADVYWDSVVAVEPDVVEDVYDMTVPGPHNFVGNGIIAHNSIEQDADMVMFLYRDEVYNPDTEFKGEAELIVAKHRNGPTGVVRLVFMNQYTKFAPLAKGQAF